MSTLVGLPLLEIDPPRLAASRCRTCGIVSCPPISFHCLEETKAELVDARARVESFTVVHIAPVRFEVPYVIAYLKLAGGQRIVSRLAESPTESTKSSWWVPELVTIGSSEAGPLMSLVFHPETGS